MSDFDNFKDNMYKNILQPERLIDFLGLQGKTINLVDFMVEAKQKIFQFFDFEFVLYLRLFDVNLQFDFPDIYSLPDNVNINFDMNGLERLPLFIKFWLGHNPYKINYVVFNELKYRFDFHQIVEFAKYIYLINEHKDFLIEGNEIVNSIIDTAFEKPKRRNFNDFIKKDLPLEEVNILVIKKMFPNHTVIRNGKNITLMKITDQKVDPKIDKKVKVDENIKNLTVNMTNDNKGIAKSKFDDLSAKESLDIIINLLNRAALHGTFNIDESYLAKIMYIKLKKVLN